MVEAGEKGWGNLIKEIADIVAKYIAMKRRNQLRVHGGTVSYFTLTQVRYWLR